MRTEERVTKQLFKLHYMVLKLLFTSQYWHHFCKRRKSINAAMLSYHICGNAMTFLFLKLNERLRKFSFFIEILKSNSNNEKNNKNTNRQR